MTRSTPTNTDDIIDSRDIIARIEELEAERDAYDDADAGPNETPSQAVTPWSEACPDDAKELRILTALAEEASGSPDWEYGETLIRNSYFKDYAEDLARDCGMIPDNLRWPCNCIDWDAAADELRHDYFAVDFDGVEYLIRA